MKVKYICMSARACALESECIKIKEGIKMDWETKVSGGRTLKIIDFFLIFFSFSFIFVQKTLIASRIQTRIVRVEGKNADH